MRLVADIGGTNARLALSQAGAVLPETEQSFRNEDFASFADLAQQVLDQYRDRDIRELVVAVAGPVWETQAKLTNRDWSFDTAKLAQGLRIPDVSLINDLTALGHALPALTASQLLPIHDQAGTGAAQGQSLIIGIGTGFNVCPVLQGTRGVQCLEAEFGHVSLPAAIRAAVPDDQQQLLDRFSTVEECFSGRGYQAVMAAGGSPDLYARMMGTLARDLLLAFMPRAGLYFNGGVARSVLTSPARAAFLEVFAQPFALSAQLTAPVALIHDDAAALLGCARVSVNR